MNETNQTPANQDRPIVDAVVIPEPQSASASEPPTGKRRPWGCLLPLLLVAGAGLLLATTIGFLGAAVVGMSGQTKLREEFVSHNRFADNTIAIIRVEGLIVDGEGFVKKQIDAVSKDESVKAVVLRVDSPGGTVTGSDYIYHHLVEMRKKRNIPIVVSMGSLAASGGYYVSMAVGDTEDAVFAEPTTWTGSIGVIIPHYNAAGLCEKLGIEEDSIASHRLKGMGSFARKMTDEERAIFQGLVDDSFARFKEIVQQGRPRFRKHPEELDKLATGQVFTANQALESGLVDKIGFLEDAVDRAVELAGLSKDDVRVIRYRKEPTLSDILLGSDVKTSLRQSSRFEDLLDLTVPKAYYLYGDLPTLLRVPASE
ncbi:hypothetical protein JCM19992_08560 [Thermostilla marina]